MKAGYAVVSVVEELQKYIDKYGYWDDYTVDQMMRVIVHELMVEVGGAEARGDLHGEHGMIRELAQVSACCIKAMMVLSGRPDANLAQTGRPAGAHSELAGPRLPASPPPS